MNDTTIKILEAMGAAALGAALTSAGDALVAGQTDWRVIAGGALLAAAAKLLPSQVFKTAPAEPPAPAK